MPPSRLLRFRPAGLTQQCSATRVPLRSYLAPSSQLRAGRWHQAALKSQAQYLRQYASEASQPFSASSSTAAPEAAAPPRSLLRRILTLAALGVFFTSAGFAMSASPAVASLNRMVSPPSDAETLSLFVPESAEVARIEAAILDHPVARALRADANYAESRPHMKIPEELRPHSLTGGTLSGPGKIAVPPLVFTERTGEDITILAYVGRDLCGHPGVVHGGLIATMLDEGFARCCFPRLPNKIGLTANLSVNYRAPLPADSFVCLRARTVRTEGRKAWVEGRLESLTDPGDKPTVYCDATALFVEPKQAAAMKRLYPGAR